ncbi:MAG TPA: TVP38/TMEM64 family protein [Gammaproteobacteria bacterium]|nr:TVP38/TMEM64 family protein [Gammaproteobacteria bacterium]|tara:strand:+ start:1141 stop:1815 length:675 start_codon:yes stop_codon:yes gene_type:complete
MVLLVAAIAVILLCVALLPVTDLLAQLLLFMQANPAVAWILFIVVYVLAVVLLLPGSVITLGGGWLFGLGQGFLLVSLASTLGATLAFLLGRSFARDWVGARLATMPRFAALDQAIAERGAVVVFLTRLAPIFPFNLLNYALGLTQIRLRQYVLASWLGMMPGTLLYVYLGSIASDLSSLLQGDLPEFGGSNWLFYVGLLATAVLTIVITRMATSALNKELESD